MSIEKLIKKLGDKIDVALGVQKFITVTNGFRGSLKRDFWVRDSEDKDWKLIKGCELIAREDRNNFPFKIYKSDYASPSFKYLKFLEFSPEKPPPVDWLVVNDDGGISYFSHFENGGIYCFAIGYNSKTTKVLYKLSHDYKFLNIEEVEW